VDTSGHGRRVGIAGHRPSTTRASDGGAARDGVRIPPDHCRAAPWRLAYEQVVTEDEPHPPPELVTIAGRLRAMPPSPTVPPTCPKHRSAAVSPGQPRSVPVPAEL
jgi:hypothetical protein